VLNETMPAVQPNAKMMPALEVCQLITLLEAWIAGTDQDDIRERKEEERPGLFVS